jgi:hypothetical protein
MKTHALQHVQLLNNLCPVSSGWVAEYKFDELRRWRFDVAAVDWKIALEVEGGAFTAGRHTRGSGFIRDMEKYNRATVLGWRLLRFTPQQMADGLYINNVQQLMNAIRRQFQ